MLRDAVWGASTPSATARRRSYTAPLRPTCFAKYRGGGRCGRGRRRPCARSNSVTRRRGPADRSDQRERRLQPRQHLRRPADAKRCSVLSIRQGPVRLRPLQSLARPDARLRFAGRLPRGICVRHGLGRHGVLPVPRAPRTQRDRARGSRPVARRPTDGHEHAGACVALEHARREIETKDARLSERFVAYQIGSVSARIRKSTDGSSTVVHTPAAGQLPRTATDPADSNSRPHSDGCSSQA